VLFLIAALAVVFADSLRRIHGWGPVWSPPGARNRLLPSAGRGARRIGAGAVILAAIAPIIVPGFGSKAVIDLSQVNGDNRVHVSPLVTIGAILNQGEDIEVFQVQSDHPAYWRMTGLDVLDGNGGWTASPEQGVPAPLEQPLPNVPQFADGTAVDATFTVKNDLAFTTLPIPFAPTELVSAANSVSWFPTSQAMSVAEWPDEGSQYRVQSRYATPTGGALRASNAERGPLFATDTKLPDAPEITEIEQLAKDWTVGARTDFDKAMAIQDHLRDTTQFHYDKTVEYEDSLAGLVDFLKNRRTGFCEQFASAMAVLLRTLDIPARVATGFTVGSPVGANTYTVSTDDLHAWVEVPFDRYGWLPFEPTQGTNTLNPEMTYSATRSGPTCLPRVRNCTGDSNGEVGGHPHQSQDTPAGREGNDPNNRLHQTPGGSLPEPAEGRAPLAVLTALIGLGAALLLAGVPFVHWLRRRRRLAHAREPRELILATYDVFSERAADLGLGRGPGETPSEYRRRIEATDLLTDGHMERLTGTVVRAAYSARPVSHDDALDATADADRVIRDLRRSTSLRRRIVGIYRRD
jgi:transglutaminase-like putative cysteine protease